MCAGDFDPALAVRLQHMADAVVALEAIPPDAQLLQILPQPDRCVRLPRRRMRLCTALLLCPMLPI
jgi:hypothetical protein